MLYFLIVSECFAHVHSHSDMWSPYLHLHITREKLMHKSILRNQPSMATSAHLVCDF